MRIRPIRPIPSATFAQMSDEEPPTALLFTLMAGVPAVV